MTLSSSSPSPTEKSGESNRRDLSWVEPQLGQSQSLTEILSCALLQAPPGRTHLAIQSALRLLEINDYIESISKNP